MKPGDRIASCIHRRQGRERYMGSRTKWSFGETDKRGGWEPSLLIVLQGQVKYNHIEKRRFFPVTLIEFYVTAIGNVFCGFIANGSYSFTLAPSIQAGIMLEPTL